MQYQIEHTVPIRANRMIFWCTRIYISFRECRIYLFENSKYILLLLNFPNGGIFMLENLFRIIFLRAMART